MCLSEKFVQLGVFCVVDDLDQKLCQYRAYTTVLIHQREWRSDFPVASLDKYSIRSGLSGMTFLINTLPFDQLLVLPRTRPPHTSLLPHDEPSHLRDQTAGTPACRCDQNLQTLFHSNNITKHHRRTPVPPNPAALAKDTFLGFLTTAVAGSTAYSTKTPLYRVSWKYRLESGLPNTASPV